MSKHVYKPVCVAAVFDLEGVKLPLTEENDSPLTGVMKTALIHHYLPRSDVVYSDSVFKIAKANAVNCAFGYITPKQLSDSPLVRVMPRKTKTWERAKDRLAKVIKITANYHLFNNEAKLLTSENLAYTEKSAVILRNLYDIVTEWPATTIHYLSASVLRCIGAGNEDKRNLSFYVFLQRLMGVYEKFCNTNSIIRNWGPEKCPGYVGIPKTVKVELCAECYNFRNLYVSKKFNRVCVTNDPFLDDVIYTCDTKTRKFVTTYLTVRNNDGVVYYPEIILDVNRVLSYSIKMNHSDSRDYDITTNQITTRQNRRVVFFVCNKHQHFKTCLQRSPCSFCQLPNLKKKKEWE